MPATKRYLSHFLIILLTFALLPAPADAEQNSVSIALPPASIAQWYKPQNKRQVWLHLMFRLGQTLHAVNSYERDGDTERMAHWAGLFAEKYRQIPVMVPQWRDEVDEAAISALEEAAGKLDVSGIKAAMKKIRQTCKSCHGEYKAATIALYRSADFSKIKAVAAKGENPMSYKELMRVLHLDLNSLKVAREDKQPEKAIYYAGKVGEKLSSLEKSCKSCHRDPEPKERILGEKTKQTMTALKEALKEPGKTKKSGRLLGELGYTVCGRCHGIHRNSSDIKRLLR